MSTMKILSLAAFVLLVPCGSVFAHHGTAGYYDQSKLVKVEGVVKEFHWRNPHSGLFVLGKDDSGNEVTYSLEMGSPAVLAKFGFSRKTFKAGDHVVLEMHPSYGSPAAGELFSGKVWLNGNPIVVNPGANEGSR